MSIPTTIPSTIAKPVRPFPVRLALILQLLALLLGLVNLLIDFTHLKQVLVIAEMALLTFGLMMGTGLVLMLTLYYFVYCGKNWARIVVALLFALALVSMLGVLKIELERGILLVALHFTQLLLQGIAVGLLFGKVGNAWFRSLAPAPVSPPVSLPVSSQGLAQLPAGRSQFVSFIAWLMMVVSVLFAFGAASLAGLMLQFIVGDEDNASLAKSLLAGLFSGKALVVAHVIWDHAVAICAGIALSFVLQFVAGIGLLQRKNWGRIATIGFMALSTVIGVAGGIATHLGMQAAIGLGLKRLSGEELKLAQQGMDTLWIGNLSIGLISIAPFVVVIWRLMMAETRREFVKPCNGE